MVAPQAPIIVLRKDDDAVSAFATTDETVRHLNEDRKGSHGFAGENLKKAEFFDAKGRRLEPVVDASGTLQDLEVGSDEHSYAEQVRERVRRRSRHAKELLKRELLKPPDTAPLSLADEKLDFEVFSRRVVTALQPRRNDDPGDHSAGWWHNTFGH